MPALQAVGAELPAAHQEKVGHGMHASSPSLFWKVPALHLPQEARPGLAATEPTGQVIQAAGSELPGIGLALPGWHAWQEVLLF